jgi:SAM-dependent methyltransferase
MKQSTDNQAYIDKLNISFWNELCGTPFAKSIGIHDFSEASLKKYDGWFFKFYPYLKKYLDRVGDGGDVLEIGLGYGTTSTYLAKKALNYFGLDIAPRSVECVNQRLQYLGKKQTAQIRSAHNLPFPDESLDSVISIGCFHHTGNMRKCIDEAYRVLKKDAILLFMCYNKNSFRMLKNAPFSVFFNLRQQLMIGQNNRRLYDVNSDNESNPFTELSSASHYKKLCSNFSNVIIEKENWEGKFRNVMLESFAKILGLDLYVICTK